MAQKTVNLGSGPDTPGADSREQAFQKVNDNAADAQSRLAALEAPWLIKPPYRPQVYGAKFDGSNDTQAWVDMLAAIKAAGGGEVIVPGGSSSVRGSHLNMPDKCFIRGQGHQNSSRIMRRPGTAAEDAAPLLRSNGESTWINRNYGCGIEDMTLYGEDRLGPILQLWHTSQFAMRNVYLDWNAGPAIQLMEVWDSNFDRVFAHGCGRTATVSTNDASVVGNEVIQFWGGLKTGPEGTYGASADSSNNLSFWRLHVENHVAPAMSVRHGLSTNAGISNHMFRFYDYKDETATLASQYLMWFDGSSGNISFHHPFIAITDQTNLALRGTTRVMRVDCAHKFTMRDADIFIATAGIVDRVVEFNGSRGWTHRFEHCEVWPVPDSVFLHTLNAQQPTWARLFASFGSSNPGLTPTGPTAWAAS